jgi:hypothetical protein
MTAAEIISHIAREVDELPGEGLFCSSAFEPLR